MSKEVAERFDDISQYKPTAVKTLNYLIALLALILIIVIYVPTVIWEEEDQIRNEGRRRMTVLNEVEKYYHQMTGKYHTDPIAVMKIVSAVRDSTMADSNFFGEQKVKLDIGDFTMNVPKNFYMLFDTTFAFSYKRKDTLIDTTYKVTKWNSELFTHDTLYILSSRWKQIKSDSSYRDVLGVETSQRIAENTYYHPYYLTEKFAYSPLVSEQYLITADSGSYKIKDPLKGKYRESRFLVFAFKDTCHGWIEDDQKSWAK
ncbi:MAG TPA: hypothetical protein DHW42_04515 [Candidatus Marinimicrobia bacterium]|nr:hypothetical protein [Candidatus Neomarinimicrobiota bacterium]